MTNNIKYLPVHEPSREYAKKLCAGLTDPSKKWAVITRWVTKTIRYDYIRAILIPKRNGLPDLDRCWKRKMGVCIDISALTVGMLRAVGINARMVFGLANRSNHAWVEAAIDGQLEIYDHDAKPGKTVLYTKERTIG